MDIMLNVFLCGQKFFGLEVLKMLHGKEGVNIVGVSAPPGRDRLFNRAVQAGHDVINAGTLNAGSLPEGIDVIICAHSHDFISKKMLLKTALGGIGYHPSLLPIHRGRDAVYWTVRMGDRIAGGTVYWLNDQVDGGDVALQDWCFTRPTDTPFNLWVRDLQPMGVSLFESVIDDLLAGDIIAVPQDNSLSTWEPSVGRPPICRPDLPMIGAPPEGYRIIKTRG